jgi:hypothetical protein
MTADTHAPAPEHHDDVDTLSVRGGGVECVEPLAIGLLLGAR